MITKLSIITSNKKNDLNMLLIPNKYSILHLLPNNFLFCDESLIKQQLCL